jgi:hypothetical protein
MERYEALEEDISIMSVQSKTLVRISCFFTLYASEKKLFFDTEEITLLENIDVSFALELSKESKEKKK